MNIHDQRRELPGRGQSDQGQPQQPSQQRPEEDSVERGGQVAVFLALAGIVLTFFYWRAGGVLDVAAVIVGARALHRAARRRSKAPGAIPAVIVGSIGTVIALALLLVTIFFHNEMQAYSDCMSGANTVQAKQHCKTALRHSLEDRLGVKVPPMPTSELTR